MKILRVITVDGPGGSGKSTVSSRVAAALGWSHLDSGALYRALACRALRDGDWDAATLAARVTGGSLRLDAGRVLLDGEDLSQPIRAPEVSAQVYRVADLPGVRAAINAYLHGRALAGPVVAEGRDMGTGAFPDAALKVFLDADPQVRALRRGAQGTETPEALAERVRRERERAVGGLKAAPDAFHVDATHLTVEEVVARILAEAAARGLGRGGEGG